MDRRSFLQSLGLASAGVAFAPLMPLAAPVKRIIFKVTCPVFKMWYWKRDNNGKMLWGSRTCVVRAFKGTLKDILNWYPNDEIFFYEELTTEYIPGHKVNIVRAAIINKEPGVTITSTSDIHTTII